MNLKLYTGFSRKTLRHIIISSFLEFGPVLLFLFSFEYVSIYEATMILMVATIVSTIVTYALQKRIPYLALYLAIVTTLFGYLTIHFHAFKFIQMRDTMYDLTCALTLMIGMVFNIRFLELAFDKVIPMTSRAWNKLTYLWVTYFIIIAMSNEIARRIFSIEDWLIFKGCALLVTSVFGLLALYVSYEEKKIV